MNKAINLFTKITKAVLLGFSITLAQFTPYFQQAVQIKADGEYIGMPGTNERIKFGSPCFVDWDDDGLEDMLLGHWPSDGKVCLFKNIGQIGSPVFTRVGNLKAAGAEIVLEGA